MKMIEVWSNVWVMTIEAETIHDAVLVFNGRFPKEKVTFAHDTDYSRITNQFKHEREVPTGV